MDQQHAEGCCFTCNKQGHISWNCLDKPDKTNKTPFQKKKAKACQAAIVDEEMSDEEGTDYGSPEANTWVHKGQVLPVSEKEDIVCQAWEAETGMLVGPKVDF